MHGPNPVSYERRCFYFVGLKYSIKLRSKNVWSTSYFVDQQNFYHVLVLMVVSDKNIWLLFFHNHRHIFALVYFTSVVCFGRGTRAYLHCLGEFLIHQIFSFEKINFTLRIFLWKPIVWSTYEGIVIYSCCIWVNKEIIFILKNLNQTSEFTQELRKCIIQCLRTSWRFEIPWINLLLQCGFPI